MKVYKKIIVFLFILLIIPFSCFALDVEPSVASSEESEDSNLIASNSYKNDSTNYVAFIDDQAKLLNDSEGKKLLDDMIPLTKYGNIAFVSTDNNLNSTENFSRNYYHEHFGTSSGSIFVIDMSNRKIYIFSDGANYNVITSSKAYSITDNSYRYASDKDYYSCAESSFKQMQSLLEGGKINEPMRYTSNVFIALTLSFFIGFLYVLSKSKIKKASVQDISKNCDITFNISNVHADKTGSHRVYSPVSDSSSGGSSGGGGGGGSSGGGGGHSF